MSSNSTTPISNKKRRRPRIRPVGSDAEISAVDKSPEAAELVSVSPDEAAAWLTGSPQYDYQEYGECEGVCVEGKCAPHKPHRGGSCCHVPPADEHNYGYHKQEHHDDTIGSFGLGWWKSKSWFCWH